MNTVELSPQIISAFQSFVLRFYTQHGRHELPWRQTSDPYKILVSELMLQQTQVNRVIPKYLDFIEMFPSVQTLASANLSQVLSLWQGLGYNRRAQFLWQLAQKLVYNSHPTQTTQNQLFPTTQEELQQLPGIGPYTASAIITFAYNQPATVIETNIRSVFLYHFFPIKTDVQKISDTQLVQLITKCLPQTNPKEWYWALMDYGSYLKKVLPNPSRKSKHHTKQSKFKGSLRQVRGEIIRLLVQQISKLNERGELKGSQYNLGFSKKELNQKITGNKLHFEAALQQLLDEKLVVKNTGQFVLP